MTIELNDKELVLAKACAKIKELKLKAKELEEEIKSQEKILKDEMEAKDLDNLVLGIFKVTWTTVNQSKFDTTRFKKDRSDLYEEYTNKSSYKRFLVD